MRKNQLQVQYQQGPIQQPSHWSMTTIPEEEVASVKDSITSRLPSHEQNLGVEASSSGGIPVWSSMGQFRVYGQKAGNDAEEVEKRRSCHLTQKKGRC